MASSPGPNLPRRALTPLSPPSGRPRLLAMPLPVPLTSLVGREREIAALASLLRSDDRAAGARLVTLIGPGGVGKTRLALGLAEELREDVAGDVAFVPLADIRDAELVAPAIASGLGLRLDEHRPVVDGLRRALQTRRLLLVLDNFEQVVPAAPLVTALLTGCPNLTVVVTSRAALRVYGERVIAVAPLLLPDPDAEPTLAVVAASEAVRLFVDRTQAVRADFALTEANAPAVVAICRRLDGLPLAIELAAAQSLVLALPVLLARLETHLPLPIDGPRDAPARLQTMRAASLRGEATARSRRSSSSAPAPSKTTSPASSPSSAPRSERPPSPPVWSRPSRRSPPEREGGNVPRRRSTPSHAMRHFPGCR